MRYYDLDLHLAIDDVWMVETAKEEIASDELSSICEQAMKGNLLLREYLIALWDGESWESIKDKLEMEGSVWLVWWMDGVKVHLANIEH